MFRRLRSWLARLRAAFTWSLAWDVFMVYLAFLNLGLIVFDITYLWLRPFYFEHTPVVTRIYDPIKGIEPHPMTESYLADVRRLEAELEAGAGPEALAPTLGGLRAASVELFETNPFELSGQTRSLLTMGVAVNEWIHDETGLPVHQLETRESFDLFWSLEPSPDRLPARVAFFEERLAPLLAVNYYRSYDLSGSLTDYFFWLDLPFLLIFTAEFLTRWYLALRRNTYARWFLFPIFNWYDLLGIIPLKQFRLFRLFRIASIYVRLRRSEHIFVGDDPISRTVQYFSNIITEEISDLVSMRILNETQEEIRSGTHRRIITIVAERHRDALTREISGKLAGVLASDRIRREAQAFLDVNLERAVESAEALRRVPLPDRLLRPLVTTTGQAVFDAVADTVASSVASAEGRQALEQIVGEVVDSVVRELAEGELEEVVREISLEVIDHVKDAVRVRKWAAPYERDRNAVRPWRGGSSA